MTNSILPENILISDYDFELPESSIPLYPLPNRQESNLLKYEAGQIEDCSFFQLPDFFSGNECLVFNDTRVIRARFHFKKDTGATIEIFLLEPVFPADYQQNFQASSEVRWSCLIGNAKRWKSGLLEADIPYAGRMIHLQAEWMRDATNPFEVRFKWNEDVSFAEMVEAYGEIPLPPYIHRSADADDILRYQTVYAQFHGSVAAPTAGLHFTPEILHQLKEKSVRQARLTLHVGAGTFKPVSVNDLREHDMHRERFIISLDFLEELLQSERIVAVGTTSVRTLESLPYLAALIQAGENDLHIEQWMPYQATTKLSRIETLQFLIQHFHRQGISMLEASTSIMIVPGFRFAFTDSLITNFHLPKSTLLLLVSAFIGDDWLKVYKHALTHSYRFLSYGDSSFLKGNSPW